MFNHHTILSYVRARWAWLIVLAFIAVALLLRLFTPVNVLPPCLWTALFHHHCPGCGLTTALLQLLRLDVRGAWDANPLIFPLLIVFFAAILRDFRKFSLLLQTESLPTEGSEPAEENVR